MQLMEDIRKENAEANIIYIYINMEHKEFRMIRNEEDLFIYQKDQIIDKADNSLFIDEIQDIDGFEHVLRSLKSKESCDVFLHG